MPFSALKLQPGFAQSKSRHCCRQLLPAPGILLHPCLRKAGETRGWVLHRPAPPVKSVVTKCHPPLRQKLLQSQIMIIIMYNFCFICKGRAGSPLSQPACLRYCGFAREKKILRDLKLQTSEAQGEAASRDPGAGVLLGRPCWGPHGHSAHTAGALRCRDMGFSSLHHP